MVKECRHGTAAFSAEMASLELVDSLDSPSRTARPVNPNEPEKAFGRLTSKNRFDRDHFIALQEADADFSDIIVALKTQQELNRASPEADLGGGFPIVPIPVSAELGGKTLGKYLPGLPRTESSTSKT